MLYLLDLHSPGFGEIESCAPQLTQTAFCPLQLPYTIFGLGLAPNFLDYMFINVTNATDYSRAHTWSQVILFMLNLLKMGRERIDNESRMSRERVAKESQKSRERVAKESRKSRERVAKESRKSRERVAKESQMSRERVVHKLVEIVCDLFLGMMTQQYNSSILITLIKQ